MKTISLLMLEHDDGRNSVVKAFLDNKEAERCADAQNDRFRNVYPSRYYWVDKIEVDETALS